MIPAQTHGQPAARTTGGTGIAGLAVIGLLLLAGLAGCMGTKVLPQADLLAPGWDVHTGQARWKPPGDKPTLAGELITARHANGDVLISFSKPPLTLFTAQKAGELWRIDFIERGRVYSGKGGPPKRFIWFWVPALIAGGEPPRDWRIASPAVDSWLLQNRKTGEEILVVIDP